MTIRETVRTTGGEVEIAAVITRDGWEFAGTMYRALFEELRPAERLNLRRVLAAQVALAKSTPTKGDNDGI
jgi:hypothetical protein